MSAIAVDALASSRAMSRAQRAVRVRRYLAGVGTVVLSGMLLVWTLLPIYNMVLISLEPEGDVFTDHIWPRVLSLESFWGVLSQGHWYLEHFLAPVRQQHLHGRDGDRVHPADRLADQLLDRSEADSPWLAGEQCGADDLREPRDVPGHPLLPDHAELRDGQQPMVRDRGARRLRHALRDLRVPGVRPQHPARGRRVRAHRWSLPAPDLSAHLPPPDGSGPRRGRHLRDAARLERVPLPVPAPLLQVEYDGPRGPRAVSQQRPVALELHDGDGDHLRAAPGGGLLRVPPPHDRRPDDGRGQGLNR